MRAPALSESDTPALVPPVAGLPVAAAVPAATASATSPGVSLQSAYAVALGALRADGVPTEPPFTTHTHQFHGTIDYVFMQAGRCVPLCHSLAVPVPAFQSCACITGGV